MSQIIWNNMEKALPKCDLLALFNSLLAISTFLLFQFLKVGLLLLPFGLVLGHLHADWTDRSSECLQHMITSINNKDDNCMCFKKHYLQVFCHWVFTLPAFPHGRMFRGTEICHGGWRNPCRDGPRTGTLLFKPDPSRTVLAVEWPARVSAKLLLNHLIFQAAR